MKRNSIHSVLQLLCLCLLPLVLTGCDTILVSAGSVVSGGASASNAAPGGFVAPPMETAEFHPDGAVQGSGVSIDLSAVAQGYVAAVATNEKRMKFLVRMGAQEYKYDLPNDGTPTVFPLQSGNGTYTFHAYQNVSGTSYIEIFSKSATVTLESEFAPFLRPSQQVNYTADSACVTLAAELAYKGATQVDVVAQVYDYVQKKIRYDYEFAAAAPKGYVSSPDATLASKKGICVDYAALVAAMLRSQGIPTKMITGYVSPDDLYHAWNMIYLEGTGWITVEIQASNNAWQRVDLTFAANGSDASFVGDGSNYVDRYVY